MRRLALAALSLACAEWRMPPTFPQQAKGQPVIHEQAVVGLSEEGDLAAVQLVDADGEEPRLALLAFGRGGEPTRALLEAPAERASAVARGVRETGSRRDAVLAALVAKEWPDAAAQAARLGYARRPPALPEAGTFRIAGARDAGALPLLLRIEQVDEPAPATALLMSDAVSSETSIELARMPLAGVPVRPQLFIQGGVAWLLSGSVLEGSALHRAVGLRRASLARGEAELHNLHGYAHYLAGDFEAASREFGRAIVADPRYVDALYNAACTAALQNRVEEALGLLRRAAAIDPGRVQVLGRNDDDLKALRQRADVRALLGLRRPPPEGVTPPP